MDREAQDKENPHVMKVATSPSFLKPKAISLRKKVNKVKNTLPLSDVDLNKNDTCGFLLKSPNTARNPFRRNECKRKREVENMDEDSNSLLWKQVNRTLDDSLAKMKNLPSPVVPSMLDESALSAFSYTVSSNLKSEIDKLPALPQSKVLPVDWSLKTKIRFISTAPFPNKGSFRTFEEVNGTIGFVRCLHSGETDKSDVHSSHGAKVFQHCLVWMHPHLPWLNLFPRLDNRLGKQNSATTLISLSMQEALHSKWCDSFRSLYQLVRLYQCPYFYMCTPTFTVLFRSAGAASIPVIHALISPTTKGFRKALREDGITFTMPLCQKDSDLSLEENVDEDLSDSAPVEDENKPLEIGEDDEPESWLESLGLSQDNLLSNKRKRRNDPAYHIDHKPESLVYVEDSETQALVNFLLNSHFCTSKIGPMAGVPPTLLAPTAFLGGTLQSLQIRHGKVKQDGKELHSMEMNGPLLPNAVHSLCTLFSTTQEGGFSAILASHTPTTPFSMVSPLSPMIPSIFAKNNMTDCGLPQPFLQEMCSKTDNMPLNTITLDKGLFTWN
ncbi:protein downstream neighbor of son homolog [Nephila pilipes]|uniref:Protein downstream neighbor of son homolog n=1 Tax=Nephila pilipes TaxID=299642 RepID=A0A8X6PW64_NEPPI|nr:protein downstream neighbor of son homolog [Nephila pilipes]